MVSPDALASLRDKLPTLDAVGPIVDVGVIDGVPDLSHPVLQGAKLKLNTQLIGKRRLGPDVHATQVASVIFGQRTPVEGLAPECSGIFQPIFMVDGPAGASLAVSQLDLARDREFGSVRRVDHKYQRRKEDVSVQAEHYLQQALDDCARRRILVVAAACAGYPLDPPGDRKSLPDA